jgi:hypothetical protein
MVDGAGTNLYQNLSRLQRRIRDIPILRDIQFTMLKKMESLHAILLS